MSAREAVLFLDLVGTFAFALNGALTAARAVRLDIVGVVILGVVTAVGGGMIRDVLIGAIPPAAFTAWYYLVVAAAAAIIVFFVKAAPGKMMGAVTMLDAVGLSLFCVVGAQKALAFGLAPMPAILIGVLTAVGGGTVRDVLIRRVPAVLTHDLYAIPAMLGAALVVVLPSGPLAGIPTALLAAIACFALRMIGLKYNLNAPQARLQRAEED